MSAVLMPPPAAHRARSPAPQCQGGADTSQPVRHKVVQHKHTHVHVQIGGPGGAQCAFKSLFGIPVRQQPEVLQ